MRLTITILFFSVLASCKTDKHEKIHDSNNYTFFLGTYTDLKSQGIYKYALENDGVLKSLGLVAISENPSFLAISANKKYLLAVNEIDKDSTGTVSAYLITKDSLKLINTKVSGGAHPCFVTLNEEGYVLAANYTGGNVGLLKLDDSGYLSDLLFVEQHYGSDVTERQQGPHAHSSWFMPKSDQIISVDLGTNELWLSKLDLDLKKLIPSSPDRIKMNPGAGPRHLVFHPNGNWIYVLNELDNTIQLLLKSVEGFYEKGAVISTLPIDYSGVNTSADIHISSDGMFVYASNRGHNSIAMFKVNMQNGSLSLLGYQSTYGGDPRNFSLSPDGKFIVVANQNTNNIVSLKRDEISGLLSYNNEIEAPTPVCILFLD